MNINSIRIRTASQYLKQYKMNLRVDFIGRIFALAMMVVATTVQYPASSEGGPSVRLQSRCCEAKASLQPRSHLIFSDQCQKKIHPTFIIPKMSGETIATLSPSSTRRHGEVQPINNDDTCPLLYRRGRRDFSIR